MQERCEIREWESRGGNTKHILGVLNHLSASVILLLLTAKIENIEMENHVVQGVEDAAIVELEQHLELLARFDENKPGIAEFWVQIEREVAAAAIIDGEEGEEGAAGPAPHADEAIGAVGPALPANDDEDEGIEADAPGSPTSTKRKLAVFRARGGNHYCVTASSVIVKLVLPGMERSKRLCNPCFLYFEQMDVERNPNARYIHEHQHFVVEGGNLGDPQTCDVCGEHISRFCDTNVCPICTGA